VAGSTDRLPTNLAESRTLLLADSGGGAGAAAAPPLAGMLVGVGGSGHDGSSYASVKSAPPPSFGGVGSVGSLSLRSDLLSRVVGRPATKPIPKPM